MTHRRWQVAPESAGERLDRYLSSRLDLPRNQVQHWIRAGSIVVEGRTPKSSLQLAGGEWIECEPLVRNQGDRMVAEEGPLEVVFEDEHLIALYKPAGLVVHPGAGRSEGTLAHRILAAYPETSEVGGPGRPGIVHRLDQGTTGLLLVARSQQAYTGLTTAFSERQIDKTYLGIVHNRPEPAEGWIEAPLGRHPKRRKEVAVRPDGRAARTGYSTLTGHITISLLRLVLETGRTHQIRVHLRHIGHPLVGDAVYGGNRCKNAPPRVRPTLSRFDRPALHAWRLAFDHPVDGNRIELKAAPPEDMRVLWRAVTETPFPLD